MKSKEIAQRLGMLALALGLIPGSSHAQSARPDTKVLAAVQACDKDSRALLEKLVSIDSGSGDAEGLGGWSRRSRGVDGAGRRGEDRSASARRVPPAWTVSAWRDGAHTDIDHADFDTLTPRTYLLTRLLMDVGHNPNGD